MKRSQYMIMDYPNLVKYFASKNPVQLLIFTVPLWSIFLYLLSKGEKAWVLYPVCFFAGVLYWTFIEYAIHRFAYHTPFKSRLINYVLGSFHLYHHKDMSDHRVLNAGFLMIYLLVPTFLGPLLLITNDLSILSATGLGLTMSYYFYEWVHYILHYKYHESGYLNYIQRYHLYHHERAPHKNFGNTSHIWDYLLGTYDQGHKSYDVSEKAKGTFIKTLKKDSHG